MNKKQIQEAETQIEVYKREIAAAKVDLENFLKKQSVKEQALRNAITFCEIKMHELMAKI